MKLGRRSSECRPTVQFRRWFGPDVGLRVNDARFLAPRRPISTIGVARILSGGALFSQKVDDPF